MQLLTFTLGEVNYGIPIDAVQSIEQRINIVRIPNTLPYIKGIINLHGNIIPIYSLAAKFGYGEQEIENIIVVEVNQLLIGIEVCKGQRILDVEEKRIIPMPEVISYSQHYIKNVANYDKNLIVLLDVRGLVSLDEQESLQKLVEEV